MRAPLERVDGALDLGSHLVEIPLGPEAPLLDARQDFSPDQAVGVARELVHRTRSRERPELPEPGGARVVAAASTRPVSPPTERVKGPGGTSSPDHAAASTLGSRGTNVKEVGGQVRWI